MGTGLNLTEPRLRVASGPQADPVHDRTADEEAPREFEVVEPGPEAGARVIRLSTEALAACGDSLEHLCRRVAVFLSRSACPASSSTVGGEQDDLKRRMDEYMLHKDYHWSLRGEDGEQPIVATGSPPQTDLESYYYSGPHPTWPTQPPRPDPQEVHPGLCSLHHEVNSLPGIQSCPQQRQPKKHIQPTWRVLIAQSQPMVLLTVRQNCWPNCDLDPKIHTRQPCLRL